MRIGQTPLVKLNLADHPTGLVVYTKLENYNFTGSVKDRMANYMLKKAFEAGQLQRGMTVVEATTGNTGLAFAALVKNYDLRMKAVMPEDMSAERKKLLQLYGAEIALTPSELGPQGAIDERDRLLNEAVNVWSPKQFTNPLNIEAHREGLGQEIRADLRRQRVKPDYFLHGVGTGGTLMGVGQPLREMFPAIKIVAVEPAESAVLGGGPSGHHGIQGIGEGFIPPLVDLALIDQVIGVSTCEAQAEMRQVLSRTGISLGLSSGANVAAVKKLGMKLSGGPKTVLTIFADGVEKYLSLLA